MNLTEAIEKVIENHSWCGCETDQGRGGYNPTHQAEMIMEFLKSAGVIK